MSTFSFLIKTGFEKDKSFCDEVLRFFKPSTPQFYNSFMNRSISVLHRHQRMGCNDSVLQCAQHNFINRAAGISKMLVGTSLCGGRNPMMPEPGGCRRDTVPRIFGRSVNPTVNDYRTIIGWFIRKSFVIFVYTKF